MTKKDQTTADVVNNNCGFTSAPSGDVLKPTEREASLLQKLWNWHEMSAQTTIVLGQPVE